MAEANFQIQIDPLPIAKAVVAMLKEQGLVAQKPQAGAESKKYISPKQAAERYDICVTTIYEIMDMPESPPTLKVGQLRKIPVVAYDAFMEEYFLKREKRKDG